MKLLASLLAIVCTTCVSSRAFSSEEVKLAFPRSSYTISYQNSDTISINCKKDRSCSVTARVNSHSFKFSAKEIDVNKIDPLFASLRTPLANQKNRDYSFEFTISTNCPSGITEKDLICFTSVSVLHGKVTGSYSFESDMPFPGPV